MAEWQPPAAALRRYLRGDISADQFEIACDLRLDPRRVLAGVETGRYSRGDAAREVLELHVESIMGGWIPPLWAAEPPRRVLGVDVSSLFDP